MVWQGTSIPNIIANHGVDRSIAIYESCALFLRLPNLRRGLKKETVVVVHFRRRPRIRNSSLTSLCCEAAKRGVVQLGDRSAPTAILEYQESASGFTKSLISPRSY